jgi:HEPN domain-containing protein
MNNFHYRDHGANDCGDLKKLVKELQQHEPEIWKLIELTIAEQEFNKHRYGSYYSKEIEDHERAEIITERIKKLKQVREVLQNLLFYNFGD